MGLAVRVKASFVIDYFRSLSPCARRPANGCVVVPSSSEHRLGRPGRAACSFLSCVSTHMSMAILMRAMLVSTLYLFSGISSSSVASQPLARQPVAFIPLRLLGSDQCRGFTAGSRPGRRDCSRAKTCHCVPEWDSWRSAPCPRSPFVSCPAGAD